MHLRLLLLCLTLQIIACSKAPAPTAAVPEVGVQTPQRRAVEVERDFIGEVKATEEAEIRSKVTGRVISVEFQEGTLVRREQPLFKIDSNSLQAGVNEAIAEVARSQANLDQANADVVRYRELVKKGSIPRKHYEDAVSKQAQLVASLAAARAQQDQAETQLHESAIISPYDGRIGRAQVNVGALVTANQTLLATVSTTDTARVDFALSEREYISMMKNRLQEQQTYQDIKVKLLLAEGTEYPEIGHITFSDRAISASTGTFAISATFPNPHEWLRPGMFARVRVIAATVPDAMLIPQRAVQEVLDKTFVSVVGADGKVERRPVVLGTNYGDEVVVKDGLKDQDQVIVEGHHKVRPGAQVKAVPLPATATTETANG
ncbi:MAG TPA: efflux RND transporter periplasmic adaptor subunit [Dongiaceae bacterium]|nr:efflux RND transporter periplasmic adaptor subunit [Dongiaceae bacterium]